jgi:VWFA-related protein
MYSWRHTASFLLLPFVVVSLRSQTAAPNAGKTVATFQANARVVVVDVVATNGKGEPVPGLHKEDFEVLEEGAPQTIATFEEHQGAAPTQFKLPPMPPNVYTNFPVIEKADSLNVLLLDSLNTPTRDQTYVHQQMIKYLGTIPPGTRVAVFTLASRLRMLQGVTTDSAELLAVINDKKGGAGVNQSALLPSDAENDADKQHIDFMIAEDSPPKPPQNMAQAAVDPVNAIQQFMADTAAFETESRIGITLEALQQLARYLSDVPGRKNVIWFSGSFPAGILPDPDLPDPWSPVRSFEPEIRKTTDLLASTQIALYPVAAEGLTADSVYQVSGGAIGQKRPTMGQRDLVKQMRTDGAGRDSNHSVMEDLAEGTGGQAFYNTNGLHEALARVINNGARYYTLTYKPTDKNMDGKFRRIRVKLINGKYNLAYRRGYYAEDAVAAPGQKPDADPLLPLMGRNFPDVAQIVYKVRVLPSDPQPPPNAPRAGSNTELKGPFTRYGVDFAVSARDLKLDPTPDGGRHGTIEVVLVAYDREGKPLNLAVSKSELALPPDAYASVLKLGLQMHKEIDVPQEDVYLRTGVYDMGSEAAGTLGFPLREAPTSRKTPTK